MVKRKSDKQKAALAERRAKLEEKNAKSKAKHDALLAAHPGLREVMDAELDAMGKREAERKADLKYLGEHGYKAWLARKRAKANSPPWLYLLEPEWKAWRENEIARGRDPDRHIEQELRKVGKWPPKG